MKITRRSTMGHTHIRKSFDERNPFEKSQLQTANAALRPGRNNARRRAADAPRGRQGEAWPKRWPCSWLQRRLSLYGLKS